MKNRALATVALLTATTACASGISTSQDFKPDFSFAELQTWNWMPDPAPASGPGARPVSEFDRNRLRTSIAAVMEDRGFQKVDGEADMMVGFVLALDEGVDYQTLNTYYGSSWGYGGMYGYPYGGMGMGSTTVQARHYTVGTLIVDVYDVASRELVWRGSGEGRLKDPTADPVERQRRSDDAVWEIMKRFPPES